MGILRKAAEFARRARALRGRTRLDRELSEEIAQHVEMRRQQLVADGMDPRDAAFEARRAFGNIAAIREETRDMRSFPSLDALMQDVRFGARLLARTPVFTAVAVLSLATGIGSAVAVFNVADAVLLRPLPVRAPEQLRGFRIDIRMGAAVKTVSGVAESSLEGIQRGSDFADFVGFRIADDVALEAGGGAAARQARVEFVSANYFDVLGVSASAGRLLTARDRQGPPTPVVVSERLWRSTFAADPAVPGRTITLNGQPAVVTGVVRRFSGLVADRPADIFAPLEASHLIDPTVSNFVVTLVGRLHPGVATPVAEQKLAALYPVAIPSMSKGVELRATLPDASRGVSSARAALERPLWLGLALVGVLVLIACANTGGLLLSRFIARQGEFGVRVAIGAGRWRLARQLSVEALLVAMMAASVGLLIGWASAPLLMRVMPETGSQVAFELRFDARLVAFTVLLTAACAVGAAAASVFRLWTSDPSVLLTSETRYTVKGSRRVAKVLIAAQVACSLLLIVGAVSMAQTLTNLRRVPLGFEPERTFVVNVNATGLANPAAMAAYHARLHERIASAPGVGRATMAQVGILTVSSTIGTVDVPGFSPASDEDRISRMFFVGPGYFETLGMPLVAGRSLIVGRRRCACCRRQSAVRNVLLRVGVRRDRARRESRRAHCRRRRRCALQHPAR